MADVPIQGAWTKPGNHDLEELAAWAMLSEDQDQAAQLCLEGIDRGEEVVLIGPAGSGKSTLLKHITERTGRRVVVACPTGKAALRATQTTGVRATTIHALIYEKVQEVGGELLFSEFRQPCSKRDLVVIDEVGMLDAELYAELKCWKPKASPLLLVGDKEQLKPVKGNWGVDLDNPTAELTQVHRQAQGSPIISFATAVRVGHGDAWMDHWLMHQDSDEVSIQGGAIEAVKWHLERREAGLDSTMLTFTHDTRRWANEAVRQVLGLQGPVAVGDRLMVKSNTKFVGVMNGEVLNVTDVEVPNPYKPTWLRVQVAERVNPIFVNTDFIEGNARDYWKWHRALSTDVRYSLPFVHVWRGDCLTTHSAQGSQFDNVTFLLDDVFRRKKKSRRAEDQDFARRFLYTAITRASKRFAIHAF